MTWTTRAARWARPTGARGTYLAATEAGEPPGTWSKDISIFHGSLGLDVINGTAADAALEKYWRENSRWIYAQCLSWERYVHDVH